MGLRSVAGDLGLSWNLIILTDASAAIGVCRRRGLGKIRHLATADLWIQDKLRCKEFQLVKVAGVDNVSDIMTKFTDRSTLEKHLLSMGLREEFGRAQSAPTIEHTNAFHFSFAFRRKSSAL